MGTPRNRDGRRKTAGKTAGVLKVYRMLKICSSTFYSSIQDVWQWFFFPYILSTIARELLWLFRFYELVPNYVILIFGDSILGDWRDRCPCELFLALKKEHDYFLSKDKNTVFGEKKNKSVFEWEDRKQFELIPL